MSWADTVKSTALTVLAERTAPTGRVSADALWTWNPYDVWLSRVRPTGEIAVRQPSATANAGLDTASGSERAVATEIDRARRADNQSAGRMLAGSAGRNSAQASGSTVHIELATCHASPTLTKSNTSMPQWLVLPSIQNSYGAQTIAMLPRTSTVGDQ